MKRNQRPHTPGRKTRRVTKSFAKGRRLRVQTVITYDYDTNRPKVKHIVHEMFR